MPYRDFINTKNLSSINLVTVNIHDPYRHPFDPVRVIRIGITRKYPHNLIKLFYLAKRGVL